MTQDSSAAGTPSKTGVTRTKDVETVLSVDGKSQGKVSLKGSTRAIRGALASCGGA